MAYLSSLSRETPVAGGDATWIACTSDRVLSLKPELYDVLVELPPAYSKQAPERIYPKLLFTSPQAVGTKRPQSVRFKATQRDARRYMTLREGLRECPRAETAAAPADDDSDNESTFSSSSIIEPLSWPLLAYSSFIWWASAGEKGAGQNEEEREQDERLLFAEDEMYNPMFPASTGRRSSFSRPEQRGCSQEVALITYFRRLTSQIFTVLFDIVTRQDEMADDSDAEDTNHPQNDGQRYQDEPDDDSAPISAAETPHEPLLPSSSRADARTANGDDDIVLINTTDITQMGLDPWSDADRAFVEELVRVWWGRKAQVQGARIQCCGVRIM